MSAISTIFDALSLFLDTTYAATSKKLTNPYVPEDNDSLTLNRGYGFLLAEANNAQVQMGCHASIRRNVVFINTVVNRGTERDITIRETAEKLLLEDQYLLISLMEKDPTLSSTTGLAKLMYLSDNGIEQIYGQDNNYLMIQTTFEMVYLEAI